MMRSTRRDELPDWYREEADAVYAAQEATEYRMTDGEGDPPDGWDEYLTPGQVEPFATSVIRLAGWSGEGPPLRFVLDVADESEWAGFYRHTTGEIHLHPRLLDPTTILHEVAHSLDPRETHGPRFVAILINLYAAAYGAGVGRIFVEECEEREVPIDYPWLHLGY